MIWIDDKAGYRQLIQDEIMGLIAEGVEANMTDRPGGIFVRNTDRIAEEDRILIQAVARVIITDSRGSLADQISGRKMVEINTPLLTPSKTSAPLLRRPFPWRAPI